MAPEKQSTNILLQFVYKWLRKSHEHHDVKEDKLRCDEIAEQIDSLTKNG